MELNQSRKLRARFCCIVVAIGALSSAQAQDLSSSTETTRGVQIVRPTTTPPPAIKPRVCPRPFPRAEINLASSTRRPSFDKALRSRLEKQPARIVVNLADPFPLGTEGPLQLSPWLREVKAKGGLVSVDQYCEAPRGLFGWLKKVFTGTANSSYGAVDGYDAVLHADGVSEKVTQVEFRRRVSGPAA